MGARVPPPELRLALVFGPGCLRKCARSGIYGCLSNKPGSAFDSSDESTLAGVLPSLFLFRNSSGFLYSTKQNSY